MDRRGRLGVVGDSGGAVAIDEDDMLDAEIGADSEDGDVPHEGVCCEGVQVWCARKGGGKDCDWSEEGMSR